MQMPNYWYCICVYVQIRIIRDILMAANTLICILMVPNA